METIRTFIAIELPESVRSALGQIQDQLRKGDYASVKWVAPSSIHLTLKFLGDVDVNKVQFLSEALSEASKGITPFQLNLEKSGAFPNLRNPRVIWVGLAGDIDTLGKLQQNIENALNPLGFPPEGRRFSPHLTLGRVRDKASSHNKRNLGEAVSALKVASSSSFEVQSVSLMRSVLSREGAIYSCLASVILDNR